MRFSRSVHQCNVEQFMLGANQAIRSDPGIPPEEDRRRQALLLLEEVTETCEALGFAVDYVLHPNISLPPDLVEIIDGCCDLRVVATGTLSMCGIPDLAFQQEVDMNNLDKIGPGSSISPAGKLIKPPGHKGPRIEELLKELADEMPPL